ncbi:SNF2-related protein [Streptomyces sp. NPDC046685]|uniref:SNF2-related protein n=1 Tax=Streptomyces sp. NPDC046685 TaxID=3157202 RepID=UPI0033FB1C45
MLNRPAARAESQDLSRGTQTKVTRRPWNPALHPRDSKGRFIETGGIVRLWGGKLARVERALPHDRILVQDKAPDGTFTGRRHTTSAKWVTMVARPDGTAPTEDENKVAAEDARRHKDPRRGNGVARDDGGDPTTPEEPHDRDDQGRPIGDDDGDGPEDDDDQDEPETGERPVNVDALPNRPNARGARFADTAAVRRHFLAQADKPDQAPEMARFLRHLALDDDLQLTPSGKYAVLRDDTTGRWYLTAVGTGQRMDTAGDFDTAQDAGQFAAHLDTTARNGHIMPGKFNEPFDFSDPNLDREARDWRSTQGENIQTAIVRARREFDAKFKPQQTPPANRRQTLAAQPATPAGPRFKTLQDVRRHWGTRIEELEADRNKPQSQRTARHLNALASSNRIKLAGDGQFVVRQNPLGGWELLDTGNGDPMAWGFDRQRDAQDFANAFTGTIKGKDGKVLDLSDPAFRAQTWRSEDDLTLHQVWTRARAQWDRDRGNHRSPANFRLEEVMRGTGNDETSTQQQDAAQPAAEASPAAAPEQREQAPGSPAPEVPAEEVAPEVPLGPSLPDGAEPVANVEGYHFTRADDGRAATVYGPDGEVAVTSTGGYRPTATINGVTIPLPRYGNLDVAIMARAHRAAQLPPGQRDAITAEWITFKGRRVMAFRGTVKGDDQDHAAVGSVKAINWAPSAPGGGAWVTMSTMGPEKRDDKVIEVLSNLARQGRYVLISDENQKNKTPDASSVRTTAPAAPERSEPRLTEAQKVLRAKSESTLKGIEDNLKHHLIAANTPARRDKIRRELADVRAEIARREAEKPVEEQTPESAEERLRALSDQELNQRIRRGTDERGIYGSRRGEAPTDQEHAELAERRRRSALIADDTTNVTGLSNEDLAAARENVSALITQHYSRSDDAEQDINRRLQSRHDEIVGEQEQRRAAAISARPPVADLSNEELDAEHTELSRREFRKAGPEAQRILEGRLEDLQREQRERQKREFTDRPAPESVDSEDLAKEYAALHRARSSYRSDEVTNALNDRKKAIEEELNRRDAKEHEQLLARVDDPTSSGSLVIDGGAPYGRIEYNAYGNHYTPEGWVYSRTGAYSSGSREGYPSRMAAVAAMVRAYDNDDSRRGERTWGRQRRVFVPKMYFELYKQLRLGDRLASATEERRHLYSLFGSSYGWDDGVNPLVPSNKKGYHIKGRNLIIPEGLLAEFQRVTEDMARAMSLQANDREQDSGERQKAKSRLAAINLVLHTVEAHREQVRKDGGNDDQKVISREEIEAQQAALRAALGGDDDEQVQQDGAGALADVPAAGVGGDGGSGGVREGEGSGDPDGDSGGRGGTGEDPAGAGGVRGGDRPDQADQGGRDRDGTPRSAAGAGARDGDGAGADAGDGRAAGAEGRGVRPVARFRPDPAGAPKGRYNRALANVEAIRVLKELQTERRAATDEDKRILAHWSGWGSMPLVFASEPQAKQPRYQQGGAREGKFEQDHARWAEYDDIRKQLQAILTPVEFRQASRGVLSMHYTPQPIAEAMWDGLRAFGFDRGDVLEAGSGAGTFFGVAPDGARLTGVELDPTTARIAQAIYPHANVLNESFAETDAHPGTFDAAIGNVPFAQIPFDDKRYAAESLHNGFITKEIALVRPGGVTMVITSRHSLDSKGDKARRKMAKYGDLIGAVRLPSGVFNEAGTGVTTDVLVFRRREDGTEPTDTGWLNAPERDVNGTPHHINSYFDEHPEHILGELTTESGPYGPQITVKGDAATAATRLREVLEEIAEKAAADGRGYEPHPDGDDRPAVVLQNAREKHANDWTGRIFQNEDDGQFYQHINGDDPVLIEPGDGNLAQLRALLELRDVAAELRELDRKNDEDERAEKLRAQLRDLHAAYVIAHGPMSKPGQHRTKGGVPTAWGWFVDDPDAAAVIALERWDADRGEPVLSRVFTERAKARRHALSATEDPKAALAAVVAATGEVDLGAVSRLLNVDEQETLRRLGSEVFTDPATGRLELAGAYLSGAVRDKLDAARKAAETDPTFAVNVAALEAVQPPERTIGQFTPEMGAHWTPPELLQGFLREYLGDRTLTVAHDDRYGWILNTGRVPEANNVMYGVVADPEKGTRGKAAVDIARAVLGFGSLTIYKDDKRKDVDEETSRLVRQKADQMRAEFAKYATANADRLTTLTESYNRIMNGHTVRSYDGMAPTLEGFTPDRDPHWWQLSGAARMQFERGVILAHEVGLGKTTALAMGTQALKASGQIEKPMAVVPNHIAQQWYDEARFSYPNADIHLITSADLAEGRRASTLEWLRANKPDLVIFTEEAFGSIKMSPEAQDEYEFRELEALREQLDRQYADADNPSHPFIIAKIEQRIATVQKRINKNAAPFRKPGETYWEDLGFDYFVVDEAHRYKGVGFRSKEGGGDPASIRGIDLHQKTTDLHRRRKGRATITLATGTPLSNSISEQYTMLQFAAPWVLDSYKAGAPDLWAATFGKKVLRIENAPDGSGLRVVERFAEFHNKRAMKTMWGLVADTKRAEDVGIPRPRVKGNAPNLIMVEATPDQKNRLKGLVARGRAIHNGEVTREQDNMLAVSNEGTSVALDPRLIDANAPAGNKLRAVAARHVERYHQHKDRVYKTAYGKNEDHPVPGALQMVFLNEGVPGGKNKGGFDAYAELRDLMVAGGIPAEKIAFVQDAKKSGKPEEVAELFRKARDGEIAVLIGSSSVAGTGMNAQNRMVSLTHVDLDWGAAQMEQRNGRILRYGNQNEEVEIDIFATKGSMDGWKAGFVAAKAEGLVDIQRPEPADGDSSDTVAEITGAEFDYETMEAEIGGNPYMSQLMKARRALRDLEIDQHNEAAERIRRAEALEALQQEAADTRAGITRREEALPRIRPVKGEAFAMTLGGSPYSDRPDAGAALHRQVTTRLLEHDREGMSPWQIIGQFGGLDFGVRTERTEDGKLKAHVGFPDLRNSSFERTPEDLKKRTAGSGMITKLSNALEKAPTLQESDRAKVPELDTQIALLQSAHTAADLTPQIDHARARAYRLEEIVARVTALDAKPELDPEELDKEKYKKNDREKIARERRESRVPLQAAVDEAVAALEQWERENPSPTAAEKVHLTEDEVRDTLARLRPANPPKEEDQSALAADNDGAGDDGSGTPPPPSAPGAADDEGEADENPVDDAEPQNTSASDDTTASESLRFSWDDPESFATITMPGALVDFLHEPGTAAMEDPDTRRALTESQPFRQGARRVTGPLDVHRALLAQAWSLAGGDGTEAEPREVRAYRTYANRIEDIAEEQRDQRRAQAAANTSVSASETPADSAPESEPETVTLTPEQVSEQLDAVRPEGSRAPSAMTDREIADEMVELMGREMTEGGLSGIDRTRMGVLEAEEARRAGRTPKREAKPEPKPEEPTGLFDVDPADTPAAPAPDPGNPLDAPDDEFGTPDMFADHEGRDTSGLRPVQMRNAADLQEGDRYTGRDGQTHTVTEKPVQTGRGRTRVVTDDGAVRYYAPDDEVRLYSPDEEIPENREEDRADDNAGTDNDPQAPGDSAPTPDGEPSADRELDRNDVRDRVERMAYLVSRALDIAGGDSLPEIHDLADAMERAEASDDPDRELRDIADRLTALAEQFELAGPRGENAADRYRKAAAIARGEDDDSAEPTDSEADTEQQQEEETQGRDDEEQRQRDRDAGGDAAGLDEASPEGAGDGPEGPDTRNDSEEDAQADEEDAQADEEDAQADEEDEEDRRRRRRRRRGNSGGPGGGGPGGPGGPGLPLPGLPLPDAAPLATPGGGNGGDGRSPRSGPHRDVDALRDAWRRGDGLTDSENTPERRTALVAAADRPGLALSAGGGIAMWPEGQPDGTALWHFAQARNGANLPGLSLATDDSQDAQALAARFEDIVGSDGQPFDWHRAWGSAVAQWRDGEGRNLRQALSAARTAFEQERQRAAAGHPEQGPEQDQEQGLAPSVSSTMELPDDLTDISDEDLAAAWGAGLSADDQMRVMAEMDRRDATDQRVRDAVPDTPPADADEIARRGAAMDAALGFGETDVVRPRRTREEQLRSEFADIDEARYQAAVDATNGYFFKRKYMGGGSTVDERELFSGGSMSAFGRWREYASEELQEWFDANGGRLTFNQFKQQRRDADRVSRDEHEERQRRAAEQPTPGTGAGVIAAPPRGLGGESEEEAAFRFGGADLMRSFADRAELGEAGGDFVPVLLDGRQIGIVRPIAQIGGREPLWDARPQFGVTIDQHSRSQSQVTAIANLVVRALQDGPANPMAPSQDVWDSVTVHLANRVHELPELPDALRSDDDVRERYDQLVALVAAFRNHQSPSGDLRVDLARARDEFDWLRETLADPKQRRQQRDVLKNLEHRSFWAARLLEGFGPATGGQDSTADGDDEAGLASRPGGDTTDATDPTDIPDTTSATGATGAQSAVDTPAAASGSGDRQAVPGGPTRSTGTTSRRSGGGPAPETASDGESGTARTPDGDAEAPAGDRSATPSPTSANRRPDSAEEPSSEPTTQEPEPDPVGGQPAHWARVGDLTLGDLVRIEGTTRRGRAVTRAGFISNTPPVQVEVTRRGRTEVMLRTWVTENADGTGASGNVFTPLNATAARAVAPEDTAPGSPASGAQSQIRTGNISDSVPSDRTGRALFPGSTVTGNGDREGAVTGATATTVSVRWADGDTEDGLAPGTLTVTGGTRPEGWTADGQRVRPGHVVTDTDGALLGPVDEVEGDRVTITTSGGTATRSAGQLRVAGEVRDDQPDTAPVTGIDHPAASDLNDGDVIVLHLDGTTATVAVTDVSRDGDRVTLIYADTTTGEIGEIEVDATAVIPRGQGPDGATPDLGADDAATPADELTVHEPPVAVDPVTGPTVDPALTPIDREIIDGHAHGPQDDPDAHQAAARISADLPVTSEQAAALARRLRDSADPATLEGRAALRAADHLDQAVGRTPPAGLGRPQPSNAAQIGEGDVIAMPDERRNDQVRVFRVIDAEDGPGGIRSLLLEDEDQQWRRRIIHGAMPVWQLPEPRPDAPTPPDVDTEPAPADPAPEPEAAAPAAPVARLRPGGLRAGDVIDAPVSRTGYQFNGHRRLTLLAPPQRNGWWMALTGVDDDGNVHDFGLHAGREVNVYERNRPTPALPPASTPSDPNPNPQSVVDQVVADHARTVAARIITEAIAGTEQPGTIHALREQIAQRLTPEALREARQAARREAHDALTAAGVTGRDRANAMEALKRARQNAHTQTVRAALRTINDLEPLPDESDEDLARRAADLLRLIPDEIGANSAPTRGEGDRAITQAATGHTDAAVAALLQELQDAGLDAGDAETVGRLLATHLDGSRQTTARRIAARAGANTPASQQPGLLAQILALLMRLGRRLVDLVKTVAAKIAQGWRNNRDRLARLRAFLGRLATRVRQWPETRRLARLQAALDLPSPDGESLSDRVAHWAALMPEAGRFGQTSRRVTWWRPTTWGQLSAGRLPDRSDRLQWSPDRAADGGPGLTALRHLAAVRAAGGDVDQDVTRRLAAELGDDFGNDPNSTLRYADAYVASTERRLVNLQTARNTSTIQDPEVELEIAAAQMEASTARREWADLRARYAAAVPTAVAAALSEIRDIGPEGSAGLVFTPQSTPDAERSLRGVQNLIPRSWLRVSAARRITAVDGDQGRYEPGAQRATIADLADDGLGTAGHALAQHLAQHLGDLDAAQRAYWFARTHTGRPGSRRMNRSALSRLLSRQQTQPDTGDSLARAVQSMFSGDWYEDDDLRAFLLGLLATR